MKKRNIGELFPIMVEEENLKVEYNFEVINIKKEDEKFKLESFNGGDKMHFVSMEFDYIFWAAPLPDFQRVADNKNGLLLYKNVEQIVKSSAYSNVATSMVDIKDVERGSQFNLFYQNINVTKFNNNVCADFDFPAAGLVTLKNHKHNRYIDSISSLSFRILQDMIM